MPACAHSSKILLFFLLTISCQVTEALGALLPELLKFVMFGIETIFVH